MSQSAILSNTLNNNNRSLGTRATNIANGSAVAAFRVDGQFISQNSTGLGGGSKYIERKDFITKGDFVQTGNEKDLAIGGQGFFVVRLQNGEIAYTANGSFRQGADGKLYLLDGSEVLFWKFDASGKPPANTSTTSSLTSLSLQGITSKAVPTTVVELRANLQSSFNPLEGPGGAINLASKNVTSAVGVTDVIAPGDTNAGALHLGDQFTLTPSSPGTTITFEYGGVAVSQKISATNVIYGQSKADGAFTIAAANAAHTGTNLVEGDGLTIQISGGTAFTFTASTLAGASGQQKFNSLSSLADAINSTGVLRARIGNNNTDPRLYISADDANKSITFTNTAGGTLVQNLGLDNVKAENTANVYRFATIQEMQQKISAAPGLAASLASGVLDFDAASALSTLKLGGSAQNIRTAYRAYANPTITTLPVGAGQNWNGARAVSIACNNHGLQAGDFVRITGAANFTPSGGAVVANSFTNGIFQVLATGVDGDSFVISTGADLDAANLANPVANGPLFNGGPNLDSLVNGFQWQKIDGHSLSGTTAGAANTDVAANVNVNGAAANLVTFTAAANSPNLALQIGDVVEITNSTAVKDGLYRVTNVAAPAFTVQCLLADLTPGGAALAAGGNIADGAAIFTKVAAVGNNQNIDTLPIQTLVGQSKVIINVNTANTNYAVGDIIAFRNMVANTAVFDGITITKDTYYTIVNVAAGQITIDLGANAGVGTAGGRFIGFNNTWGGGVGNALAQAAGTILGPNAYVDYIGREYAALGVTIGVGQAPISTTQLQNGLAATYDPANSALNFAGGGVTANTWSMSTNIIDNQGSNHLVSITFGKVDANTWAAEIYSVKKADGKYEVTTSNGGQLAKGYLEFDGQGQLKSVDANLKNLVINWTNGAVSSNVQIDWGAIGGLGLDGKQAQPGVVQLDTANNDMGGSQNGKIPGNVNGYSFDESGVFYVTFDNGETVKVGQLAIASFQNFNGLTQKGGYLYESSESGAVLLKTAGSGGVGAISTGGVTGSAVDDTGEFMGTIGDAQNQMLATQVASKINAAEDFLVRNLG